MQQRPDEIAEMKTADHSTGGSPMQLPVCDGRSNIIFSLCLLCLCGSISVAIGCSESTAATQPSTLRDRQDALLRDPFSDTKSQNVDISGGKINELDREALKRDINNVFNP